MLDINSTNPAEECNSELTNYSVTALRGSIDSEIDEHEGVFNNDLYSEQDQINDANDVAKVDCAGKVWAAENVDEIRWVAYSRRLQD